MSGPSPEIPALDRSVTGAPSIAIVGGGLAGLAAAVCLCDKRLDLTLYEARRMLGGRAGSFHDAETGDWLDHCQHVAMGCCTHFADFCRRTGVDRLLCRETTLQFIGPAGERITMRAAPWLPAPLHLAPFLARLSYLSWRERYAVARTLLRLARPMPRSSKEATVIGRWLAEHGQTPRAVNRFWAPVLVSALGESLDRASTAAARQVFVDGFLVHRQAFELIRPTVSLGELYDQHVASFLRGRRVRIRCGNPVQQVQAAGPRRFCLQLADGTRQHHDVVIVAVPWTRICDVLSTQLVDTLPELAFVGDLQSAPITAVHLWFDRPVIDTPHAVFIDRLAQWVFSRGTSPTGAGLPDQHYCQVVISASRHLAGRDRSSIVEHVRRELADVWPQTRHASLVRWQVVSQRSAVFSMVPGVDQCRPPQVTSVPHLLLAGDWTDTGWPATMEGAVRSGYLAAQAVFQACGRPPHPTIPDLPPSRLFKLLCPPG